MKTETELKQDMITTFGQNFVPVLDIIVPYFKSNEWLFIKHPSLNYESPYMYMVNAMEKLKQTALQDTFSK